MKSNKSNSKKSRALRSKKSKSKKNTKKVNKHVMKGGAGKNVSPGSGLVQQVAEAAEKLQSTEAVPPSNLGDKIKAVQNLPPKKPVLTILDAPKKYTDNGPNVEKLITHGPTDVTTQVYRLPDSAKQTKRRPGQHIRVSGGNDAAIVRSPPQSFKLPSSPSSPSSQSLAVRKGKFAQTIFQGKPKKVI